mgnify:FL=1
MTDTDRPAKETRGDNLTGHFLIAMPSLDDSYFNQAVTYICEHEDNGSFGVVINQQSNITLQQIAEEMKIETVSAPVNDQPVFVGGPVEQGRGFILHRPVGNWQSSMKLSDTVALTTSKDILSAILTNEGPDDSIVALGYAGWSAGQLDDEMARNTWLTCPADEEIMFQTPPEKRWRAAAEKIGIDMTLLSNDAGHA